MFLPGSELSRVDMDKAGTRVVADPSQLQGHSRLPDRFQVDARDVDVHGPTEEVEAVSGDTPAFGHKERVVGRRPEAGDDVDLVSTSQPLIDKVEIFNGVDIHVGLLVGEVAAQNPVYRIECVEIIAAVRPPEGNREPFA